MQKTVTRAGLVSPPKGSTRRDRESDARRAHRSLETDPRRGEWLADPGFGVYVHIPFCAHRCHYCDFNTYEGLDELFRPYVDALVRDIETSSGEMTPATSVFFGGGTPSLLPPQWLGRVLAAVGARVGIAPDAEITVEVNPETVDENAFEGLLVAGFTRISIGVQSLAPIVLGRLGRTHSAERALGAIAAARRAGVRDCNADLIYGSPWETDEAWRRSLEGIVDARTDHVSAYALTVEEGTPLHTLVATGRVPDVDPDVQAARHALAEKILGDAGFLRYEISNWARRGHASRHNVLYWSAGDYCGFGAGAHAHVRGRRSWTKRLPRDYIRAVDSGASPEAGWEMLDVDRRASEALMLGLRLTSGIDTEAFSRRFGDSCLRDREEVIESSLQAGWLERCDGNLRVSSGASMLANDVVARLL
jgi:oxygen-independent coproporphyrinogen-3 oxidase